MQEIAPTSKKGSESRLCGHCRADAQLRTPSGSYCAHHAWQIYLKEAELALPDWVPWVMRRGDNPPDVAGPAE